jgi:hypothetical protein
MASLSLNLLPRPSSLPTASLSLLPRPSSPRTNRHPLRSLSPRPWDPAAPRSCNPEQPNPHLQTQWAGPWSCHRTQTRARTVLHPRSPPHRREATDHHNLLLQRSRAMLPRCRRRRGCRSRHHRRHRRPELNPSGHRPGPNRHPSSRSQPRWLSRLSPEAGRGSSATTTALRRSSHRREVAGSSRNPNPRQHNPHRRLDTGRRCASRRSSVPTAPPTSTRA